MTMARLLCCRVFMLLAATISTFSYAGTDLSSCASANVKIVRTPRVTADHRRTSTKSFLSRSEQMQNDAIDLNDYRPYDPSPSSRSRIHSGPIYHNTPLNPHIPKSPPHFKGHKQSPVPPEHP